jgi:uncharacterized membrane protein
MSCCFAGSGDYDESNRQEEKKDRRKRYMINLKSELEIRMLHEKLDHLIMQQEELIEIKKYKSKDE